MRFQRSGLSLTVPSRIVISLQAEAEWIIFWNVITESAEHQHQLPTLMVLPCQLVTKFMYEFMYVASCVSAAACQTPCTCSASSGSIMHRSGIWSV